MPTARRVTVAAALFAAALSLSSPALAAPGQPPAPKSSHPTSTHAKVTPAKSTHSRPTGRRAAAPGPSATAVEHAAGLRAKAARPGHAKTTGTSRGNGHRTHTATRTVTASAVLSGPTKRHGRHPTTATTTTRTSTATAGGKDSGKGGGGPATSGHGKATTKAATKPATSRTTPAKAHTPTTKPAKASSTGRAPATAAGRVVATGSGALAARDTTGDSGFFSVVAQAGSRPVAQRPAARPATSKQHSPSTTTAEPTQTLPISPVPVLRQIGNQIARYTGIGLFSGPYGWIFTALFLFALVMMGGAFVLGRRPRPTA